MKGFSFGLKSFFGICLFLGLSSLALATEIPQWTISVPDSHIQFTGQQNNAPISGEFKQFEGQIFFSPEQLTESKAEFTIDIASLWTSYKAIADALKEEDWFNAALFPKASFASDSVTLLENKTYEVKGKLSIRDKSAPLTFQFNLTEYTPEQARLSGSFTINRTDYGVGQGDWASTDEIKDQVKVKFDLVLNIKK